MTVGGLSMLASNYLCPPTEVGDDDPLEKVTGCSEVCSCGTLYYFIPETVAWQPWTVYGQAQNYFKKINGTEVNARTGSWGTDIFYVNCDGQTGTYRAEGFNDEYIQSQTQWKLVDNNDLGCCEGDRDTHPLPPDADNPIIYEDPVTNCTYNVTLQGFVQESEGGPARPVLRIVGTTETGPGARAGGGIIGGCNFNPVIHVPDPGGGGGGTTIPEPPDQPPEDPDGLPWWLGPVTGALTGAVLNTISRLLTNSITTTMAPGSFTLTAPCEFDENGEPLNAQWGFAQQPWFERINDQQVVIMEILQQHLDFKTPICGDASNEKPPLEGQWVTTRWESLEKMDHSGRHLRKLFRYRTKSTRDLGQLSAYWADFTWKSGAVCVIHQGAWWGTPQVWAESEAEGQRVIRHAAAEAGIDPDQAGQWTTSSSRAPRYGMSGTMKATRYKGFPWIASRDGAAWPNTLALQRDP
jgi:hypothetical protein